MNIFLWVLQVLLAFFCLSGGYWKISNRDKVSNTLPGGAWALLGVLEVVCALGLIIPAAAKIVPVATPAAALVLALEGIFLAILFGRKNTKFSKANPMVYALLEAVMAVVIAYGRFVLSPI
ncbi:MAG TPA: DoxX family protein [bacterium]|nr:DoxX family protein [bacterium]